MAGIAAAFFHPHLAGRQFGLVVEDDDAAELELVEIRGFRDRAAQLVHEGAGQQQQNFFAGDRALDGDALETAAPRRDVVSAAPPPATP